MLLTVGVSLVQVKNSKFEGIHPPNIGVWGNMAIKTECDDFLNPIFI